MKILLSALIAAQLFSAPSIKAVGCLGQPVEACYSNLDEVFSIPDILRDGQDQLKRNNRVDLNGVPLYPTKKIHVFGYFTGSSELSYITLGYSSENIITSAAVSLDHSLESAKTLQDFEATGLYSRVKLILGEKCPGEKELYAFFYNELLPNLPRAKRDVQIFDTSASTSYKTQAEENFHEYTFSYSSDFGTDTNLIDFSSHNYHGSYGGFIVTIKEVSPKPVVPLEYRRDARHLKAAGKYSILAQTDFKPIPSGMAGVDVEVSETSTENSTEVITYVVKHNVISPNIPKMFEMYLKSFKQVESLVMSEATFSGVRVSNMSARITTRNQGLLGPRGKVYHCKATAFVNGTDLVVFYVWVNEDASEQATKILNSLVF